VQRAELFKTRCREVLNKVRVVQGKTNEARTLTACFDDTLPKDNDKALYLWIQDGWQNEEKSILAEARAKGVDNPTLFAFIPAQNKTDLANAIVTLEAARNTLHRKGSPNTEEGRDAQRSMESRQRNAEKEITDILAKLFAGVKVFQAGGQEVTQGNDLAERLNKAAKASVVRLYREFDTADQEGWGKVLDEARKGNAEALKAVGHTQEADKHAVCQKILAYIGPGKRGSEVRDHFEEPPFGWPRDAIDGALFTLLTTGHLRATDASGKAVDAKSLDRNKLTQASFRQESDIITPVMKIKIRGLFTTLGVPCQPNEELAKAPFLIAKLKNLAQAAGGAAPRPTPPKQDAIEALEAQSGNALLFELFTRCDQLTSLAKAWDSLAQAIAKRETVWTQLDDLLDHAKELGPYAGLKAEMQAVIDQRSLLAEPDPVHPLLDRSVDVLRQALNAKLGAYAQDFEAQNTQLGADANWQKLTAEQQAKLIAEHHIISPASLDISTADKLADALDACNLQRWIERAQAVPTRFDALRMSATKLLKPNVVQVSLPRRTLNSADEVKTWLAEVEKLLLEKVEKGPVAL